MEGTQQANNVFKQIWRQPRAVFATLNKDSYNKYTYILLILAGIARTFDGAMADNRGDQFSLLQISLMSIVIGGLFGWIVYYVFALLLQWTGRWLGGTATKKQLLNMLAHAMIPIALGLILLIPRVLLFGNEIFKSDGNVYDVSLFARIIDRSALLGQWLLSIYAFVLCVIGISEVQNIPIRKAFLNFFLPVIMVFVPLAFLVWLLIAPSL